MAVDYAKDYLPSHELIGGYFSPVGDGYGKKGLAKGEDRVKMLQLATEASDWLMVDDWEVRIKEYTKTAYVMDHVEEELGKVGKDKCGFSRGCFWRFRFSGING